MSFSAFEGDGVVAPATEEKSVVLVGEMLGPGFDLGFEFRHLVHGHRQVAQAFQIGALAFRGQAPAHLARTRVRRKRAASWVVKGLGRGDADFQAGPGDEAQRRFADDGRFGRCRWPGYATGRGTLAWRRAARVSAVSPDWDTATTSWSGSGTEVR